MLGTYCDLVGLLSVLVFRRKMYDNKDLRPFRACFLKTQVETFDFPLESFMPVGRTSGTVTVTVVKFS